MKKLFIGVFSAIVAALGCAALLIHWTGPSTASIDSDLKSVRTEILETQADAAKYGGGLILVEIQLRLATLQNTEAMLDQKRLSFLRGIELRYTDGIPRAEISSDVQNQLDAEISKANADATAADAEASRYSGGLIQTMALVRAATSRMTAAAASQQKVLSRYGIQIPALAPGGSQSVVAPPSPGKKTSDKDALQ